MILSDPDDFRIKSHDFSGPASNCLDRVIEAVQNVKIEDFPKNHDSEHDFDDQHDVNGRKSCSILVILIDPNDFRDKNHDFSARVTN